MNRADYISALLNSPESRLGIYNCVQFEFCIFIMKSVYSWMLHRRLYRWSQRTSSSWSRSPVTIHAKARPKHCEHHPFIHASKHVLDFDETSWVKTEAQIRLHVWGGKIFMPHCANRFRIWVVDTMMTALNDSQNLWRPVHGHHHPHIIILWQLLPFVCAKALLYLTGFKLLFLIISIFL